jgi:hypothetical protein
LDTLENIRPKSGKLNYDIDHQQGQRLSHIEEYFRRRMYDGEIVKTENLMNRSLVEYCPTPDSLKREQERIESQLVAFEQALYLQPDTATTTADVKEKSVKKTSTRSSRVSSTKETKTKTQKQKKVLLTGAYGRR